MKITHGQHYYLNAVKQNKQATVQSNSKAVESTTKKEYISVDISDEARKLSEASMQAAPSERAAVIKAAIKAGTYEVSVEKIAEGLMEAMAGQKKVEE
ncbi:flagellar biosynthesis anti-sigma factor FlgM [Jeotgalibaca porci]|uniref:flagellar biosynthesis anti-sigma factor FlgM n=1 Tax=Jeotgalibaca porci TaxID=1868793 RepID=UPI0035A0F616